MKQIVEGENSFEEDDCIATKIAKDLVARKVFLIGCGKAIVKKGMIGRAAYEAAL